MPDDLRQPWEFFPYDTVIERTTTMDGDQLTWRRRTPGGKPAGSDMSRHGIVVFFVAMIGSIVLLNCVGCWGTLAAGLLSAVGMSFPHLLSEYGLLAWVVLFVAVGLATGFGLYRHQHPRRELHASAAGLRIDGTLFDWADVEVLPPADIRASLCTLRLALRRRRVIAFRNLLHTEADGIVRFLEEARPDALGVRDEAAREALKALRQGQAGLDRV